MTRGFVVAAMVAMAGAMVVAQDARPLSPVGAAAAQVLGKYVKPSSDSGAQAIGWGSFQGGKWIEIVYGRPLKRGRALWGSGADYGKAVLGGAPLWRAGANASTRLKTEVPLVINGVTVAPGEYSLFIDLKENNWTLVVSTWGAQTKYDPADKTALWGAYGYTPDKDVVRAPMKLDTLPNSIEQLTWEFVDLTDTGGTIALVWDRVMASVSFKL